MKEIIKNNSKFIIVMLLVIILGVVGVTTAIRVANFNPITLNTTTANIGVNITYDSTNTSTITSNGKMLPIADSLVTGTSVTDTRVLKAKFMISGKSGNPNNSIYDIALRNITMDKELKSLYVKWRLYKNNTLLSEGNFSPSFDIKENNRMVLTNTQQDLTTSTDTYVFLMWISEACTGELANCTNSNNQYKYLDRTFSFNIKIEASTKTKKVLVRDKASIGDINGDGKMNALDVGKLLSHVNGTTLLSDEQLKNADVNADGKIDNVDYQLIYGFTKGIYPNTLPDEPITDYVLYGDINEDGKINTSDMTMLNAYLRGTKTLSRQQLKNADINGDGKVDSTDYNILNKAARGSITCNVTSPCSG